LPKRLLRFSGKRTKTKASTLIVFRAKHAANIGHFLLNKQLKTIEKWLFSTLGGNSLHCQA